MTRVNPVAVEYLQRHNVMMIVFPSHLSHIIQPFDVGCGSPLKTMFKKLLIEIGSQIQNDNMSITDWMRLVAITSFTEAIERTITPWNVSSAFKRSCLFPFDPNMIINNSFVIDASNPSPTRPRGYVCSGKVVTDLDELQRMYISLLPRRPQSHITMVKIDPIVAQRCLMHETLIEGRLLTPFHPKMIFESDNWKLIRF